MHRYQAKIKSLFRPTPNILTVEQRLEELKKSREEAKACLKLAAEAMKNQHDKYGIKGPNFKTGDLHPPPLAPAFYITTNHQVMTHDNIKWCECQLITKLLNKAHLVNTENWILKWNHNQQEEMHVHMGHPRALDFFKTDSHIQKWVHPILPIPIITINQAPILHRLDYSKACPKSLHPLLPIIQTNPAQEVKGVFDSHPLLLEDTQPRACSPLYHPSTPVYSPHLSDYQPMKDMEVDKWNGHANYASPPLVPIDASSSDGSLPLLQPSSSTASSESLPPP
ncbi:hypothetical protein JAAARDRAFT_198776 [Jaapia argillacea MUCL 33604]|uniref:Uncharacterized protein n=1 Tax=Jaapia argillacea MUCL 33604 TaxID=933084 RepID=A0A067PLL3_9AGAM|nr:hypothetical protein JAAARDRAFT_198776 [Jaapia argillacea MUCL 33604]